MSVHNIHLVTVRVTAAVRLRLPPVQLDAAAGDGAVVAHERRVRGVRGRMASPDDQDRGYQGEEMRLAVHPRPRLAPQAYFEPCKNEFSKKY